MTCGLTRLTRVFPCTKHITGVKTTRLLLEEWFSGYGAPKEIHSDEDVRVSSHHKRFLRSFNVQGLRGSLHSYP